MFQRVILPSGKMLTLYERPGKARVDVASDAVEYWQKYCENNWMSTNHESAACGERKVKRLLDGFAWFILQGNVEGAVTPYKEIMNGSREIPVTSCPAEIRDLFYTDTYSRMRADEADEHEMFNTMLDHLDAKAEKAYKPKPRKKARPLTRFQKTGLIRKELQDEFGDDKCEWTFCRVDAKNRFTFGSQEHVISSGVKAYRPKRTYEGKYYPIDQIIVIHRDGQPVRFLDQNLNPIDKESIRVRNARAKRIKQNKQI